MTYNINLFILSSTQKAEEIPWVGNVESLIQFAWYSLSRSSVNSLMFNFKVVFDLKETSVE